jgi:hypothetical protein
LLLAFLLLGRHMNTSQIENLPGVKWALRHPRVAAWIVLSVGMVVLLIIEARDVGLLATQWVALVAACVLVAGLCVWIISWEDEDETPESPTDKTLNEKSEDKTAP